MTSLRKQTIEAIVNVFETGSVSGNYAEISVLAGDAGHLSYGRSQAALGAGSLFNLLSTYVQRPDAKFATALRPFMRRVEDKDTSLDHDAAFHSILKQAAGDPAMRATQDNFFDQGYFPSACQSASNLGVTSALGLAVIYDSRIQGGWNHLRAQLPPVPDAGGENAWITAYVTLRRKWLLAGAPPLPNTVYRMDTFAALIAAGNWDLSLPIGVRGVAITEALLTAGL